MDKETIHLIITGAFTLGGALLSPWIATYFTFWLNKKQIKDNEFKKLVEDIKSFAQKSLNLARENKGWTKRELIKATRSLPEYQSYFYAFRLSGDNLDDNSKKLKEIVKTYRGEYRKRLVDNDDNLNENDITSLNKGFFYILREFINFSK